MSDRMYGAVEAGGTKFVCAVGTGHLDIYRRVRIPTTNPADTIRAMCAFLAEDGVVLDGVGIASFGPLELREDHPMYGHVVDTPKPGWSGADLVGPVAKLIGAPVGLQTDVVGAAMAEWMWGAGRGVRNVLYVTVGTGIGGGVVIDGHPIPGLVHAEMGHIEVRRHPADDFPGICPFHKDCLEGMAAGPAIEKRWGRRGEDLGSDTEKAIELEAHYLASGLRSVVYMVAPDRIIIGGGVAALPGLVDQVGVRLVEELSGYGVQPEHRAGFVVPPGLGDAAGLAGAFALAKSAAQPR